MLQPIASEKNNNLKQLFNDKKITPLNRQLMP